MGYRVTVSQKKSGEGGGVRGRGGRRRKFKIARLGVGACL
jgi:hypothetical protein